MKWGRRAWAEIRKSVLNAHNQVHDVRNVFMTDGACMTSASVRESFADVYGAYGKACDYAVSQMKKNEL